MMSLFEHTTFGLASILFIVLFLLQYLVFEAMKMEQIKTEMDSWSDEEWDEWYEDNKKLWGEE